MGKFSSRLPRSRKPDQPGLSYEHVDIFTKNRLARRDFGNQASLVDRAHMKRPFSTLYRVGLFDREGDSQTGNKKIKRFSTRTGAAQYLVNVFQIWTPKRSLRDLHIRSIKITPPPKIRLD